MKLNKIVLMCLLSLLSSVATAHHEKKKIIVVVGSKDSIIVANAFKELYEIPEVSEHYLFQLITEHDIQSDKIMPENIQESHIIFADFMYRDFDEFLADKLKAGKVTIYGLRNQSLAEKLIKSGHKIKDQAAKYYYPPTVDNFKNLILMAIANEGGGVAYEPPFTLPESGIFHPDTEETFPAFEEYLNWYKKTGKYKKGSFWVGVHTFHTYALKDTGKVEAHLIHSLEEKGINVLPVYGRAPYYKSLGKYFLDENGESRVQILCGFTFRFLRGFKEETDSILQKMNAPVFMPLSLFWRTIDQWEDSIEGIASTGVAWQVCGPEQNGAIEPTLVGGKIAVKMEGIANSVFDTVPMPEHIDFLIKRIKALHNIQAKPDKDKKIAILYWNNPPGKENIGASYMNLFRSVSNILSSMKESGYSIKGELPNEEEIKKKVLLSGRNVGSWAPGELDKLIASGNVVKIPVSKYKEWFNELDKDFREEVIRQWGRPEESDVMIKNKEIIIPLIDLGNIILTPQPSRGFGEDSDLLYHDPKVYPHHQYIAFYFWLKNEFNVDAIISLGKHGTHEWLPGKQIGLSLSCAPEMLIQDIPNIYPYIVDNVGEGIQAKRRGRAIIIDHLIPPLKKGGSYMEYRELVTLIDEYHNAAVKDKPLAEEKLKSVRELVGKLGLDKDLGLDKLDDNAIIKIEDYIIELQETLIPYGLHTFGVSPDGESLTDLVDAICEASPEINKEDMRSRLKQCGDNEMESLLKALNGEYIPSGQGNDPIRNPESVPTGKNFYGFNVDKAPSKEAYRLGKKMADGIIKDYMEKHDAYPDKIGIILWSTEMQRNEGVSESAILHLLGVSPVWDKKDKVVDLQPIPGMILKRPRIDVLIQTSGLYRDSYARVLKMLDKAVRMAGALKDVENFIAKNSAKIEIALLEKGYNKEDAKEFSRARIFGPMPGAYVHSLQILIPSSGVWDKDDEIADVHIHHNSFAYGEKMWGKSLKSAYKSNLKDVKVTVHTRSSNLYNMLDNDDMYAFLGGLSLAVKKESGSYPEVLVVNLKDKNNLTLDDLPKAIGKALRTRYLNPKWIEGMKKEGYAGARDMRYFVENLWGFQVTAPFAVDKTYWEEIHDVYIEDKYGMDLKEFFDKHNPWALQSIAARMLEADRKGYWQPPEEMKKNLAKTYVLSVIEKGVACCEHTCNNPMLQKFVANIISLSGLLTTEQLELFKLEIAKATGKTQEENEQDLKRRRESLLKTINEIRKDENIKATGKPQDKNDADIKEPAESLTNKRDEVQKEESAKAKTEGKKIEGYEMVEEKMEETKISSSGSTWVVMLLVIGVLVLLLAGWKSKKI
ncbi:MAG: cobaltochelatase subunit CobN [Candidatus Anammoxibacter sp.]